LEPGDHKPKSEEQGDPSRDDSALPMDPPAEAIAGETDLFGVPVQKDLFGNESSVTDERTKKR
jgi:hypothetical protein